ncbi:MAG: aminopeptidase P family N-terminal domain-containing protein [Planctomycetaceae bacterium]|nr:aminopeptidase P family N-terminal domain-containing protein [Planctomycetaceae bacterium]
MSTLTRVTLPDFGREARQPQIPNELYRRRMAAAEARMERAGLDVLVVYGDREHFANVMYLTGFDPRFEEALLLIGGGRKLLLVGNECMGYLPDEALGIKAELFQEFSLPGQPRGNSRALRAILSDFGIARGTRVGCAGWKYFEPPLIEGGSSAIEIPAYLVDLLRDLTRGEGSVSNAGDIFMDVADGLRIINEPEQIAQYEYAASVTSTGVLELMRHVKPGAVECDLEKHLDSRGLPLTCHRMLSFGAKAKRGLASAGDNTASLGDPYTTAFGVVGALTCRAGWVANKLEDLPAGDRDFCMAYAKNYFGVVAAWYASLRVGVTGGRVFAAVDAARDKTLYDFAVNPGHYLHLEEWTHSPFAAGSGVALRSGMMLQMDIIPISRGPFCYINAEDGVALADADLRRKIAAEFPAAWKRIERRRAFMREVIGIDLDECVLPMSNMPAWLPPFVMDLDRAMVM